MGWEIGLLTSFAPVLMEGLKSLFQGATRKFVGLSVDDEIKLANADVERLKALAQLDTPVGTPSQWIVDLRSAFRYIAAFILILGGLNIAGAGVYYKQQALVETGLALAVAPFSFIFGERLFLPMMGKAK